MYLAKTSEGSKTVVTDIGGLEWDHVSAERGRTGSTLQGELVASMTHKRPLCLFGGGLAKLARLNQDFTMCKTYERWIGVGLTNQM